MPTLAGYHITHILFESSRSLVYRGYREADTQAVIIKMLKGSHHTPEHVAWFRREYECICRLNLPGVVRAYDFSSDQQDWFMVLEDFGGESLTRLQLAGKLSLDDTLTLAIAITDIVGQIHEQYIIHKDINPSNIILNPKTGQIKLIDFGISSMLTHEPLNIQTTQILEGSLAYMSPEQTRRINRPLDYRTDFYSLGVTLYELLTGHLPFVGDDALTLIHSHIARQPIPLHHLVPEIPPTLSALVLKLMDKNVEDRYYSAYGIKADLERCLHEWRSNGQISPFVLGEADIDDRLRIPHHLYGREQHIATLHAAFERISQGTSELLLVTGPAGVGKTALVHEVYRPPHHQHAYVVAGKFEQAQQTTPYAAIIAAVRTLVNHLLSSSADDLAIWRQRLLNALGTNGQVIIDVISDVEAIIGPQPAVLPLAPGEAQQRLNLVFRQFIAAFAQPGHALVLILDDLHWADRASLALLEALLTGLRHHHLLVIGTYRNNEIDHTHPLSGTLQTLEQAGVRMQSLELSLLDASTVTHLIRETLHYSHEEARPLVDVLMSRTLGNPFFLKAFVQSLYHKRIIQFDHQRGTWQCDLEQIHLYQAHDNVIDLMADNVQRLSQVTQTVLMHAACTGFQFDVPTLAAIGGKSWGETAADLDAAVEAGMVLPLHTDEQAVARDVPDLEHPMQVEYRFAHDRIHQAVYNLIPPGEQPAIHWRVGLAHLQHIPAHQHEEHIFDIVTQLNLGLPALFHSEAEAPPDTGSVPSREEVARLNLRACRKARTAAAYHAAYQYATTGLSLLSAESWQHQYDLTLALSLEAMDTAYLAGDFDTTYRLCETILQQSPTLQDHVHVYETRISAGFAQNRLAETVQIALDALRLLGVTLPEQPDEHDIVATFEETRAMLADWTMEELLNLPPMTDEQLLAAMRIMVSMYAAVYNMGSPLLPLLTFRGVSLSVRSGNAPDSAYFYAFYGLLLLNMLQDIDAGYTFGELAMRLIAQHDQYKYKARTIHIVTFFLRHWKEHWPAVQPTFLEVYRSGLEMGDVEYAALGAHCYGLFAMFCGTELRSLEQELEHSSQTIAQLQQNTPYYYNRLYQQAVQNLLGQSSHPCHLRGAAYDEEQMWPQHQQANDKTAMYVAHLLKGILCYLFGDSEQALEHATSAEQYIDAATGMILVPLHHFYATLARLACLETRAADTRASLLEQAHESYQQMQHWARHAPMNYAHRVALIEAEFARVEGSEQAASLAYDRAIDLAQQHGYLQDEALAYELAARFYLAQERTRIARAYVRAAHAAYLRWGAVVCVRDLETRYAAILDRVAVARDNHDTLTITTWHGDTDALDTASAIKAAQVIAGEIVLEKLLAKLMHFVIENAGAQRGVLLLEQAGQWVIEAESSIAHDNITLLQSIPLDALESPTVPATIISYVARTHHTVVLNDAQHDSQFKHDPYMLAHQPLSILCTPLVYQGNLTAVLYLENTLTTDVFTADRLHILNLISAQAAISIENARLYADIQTSESKYRFLFEDSRDTIFITTPQGEIIDVSPACHELFGYTRAEMLHHKAYEFYANPEERRHFQRELEQNDTVRDFEVAFRHRDGSIRDCLMTATLRRAEDGTPLVFQGNIRDITERKQAEEALHSYRTHLEEMVAARTSELSHANQALQVEITERTSAQDELHQVNEQLAQRVKELNQHNQDMLLLNEMAQMLQRFPTVDEACEILTQFAAKLFPTQHGTLYIRAPHGQLEAVASWGTESNAVKMLDARQCRVFHDGQPTPTKHHAQECVCLAEPAVTPYLCVPIIIQDTVTGLIHLSKAAHATVQADAHSLRVITMVADHFALTLSNLYLREQLREQSIRDTLTGLFNRRYLDEMLPRELQRAERQRQPVGIILLDIDHFKYVNDTYGHDAGDILLQTMGAFLQQTIRGHDIACRYGGEEFILVLPGASLQDTLQRAEQIRGEVQTLVVEHQGQVLDSITASLGVATFPGHDMTAAMLIRAADQALYQAKGNGRNCVITASTPGTMLS
jgi:diguanylate cyclase (GGDEF)-like protein/PAS domain S-box-containing protein